MVVIREQGGKVRRYGQHRRTLAKRSRGGAVSRGTPNFGGLPSQIASGLWGPSGANFVGTAVDYMRGNASWGDVKRAEQAYKAPGWNQKFQNMLHSVGNWEKRQLQKVFGGGKRSAPAIAAPPAKKTSSGGALVPSKPKASLRKMRRKIDVRGYGGKKFSKRKRTKLSVGLRSGSVQKVEQAISIASAKCLYVGHNSHSIQTTIRGIGLAIVRLVARRWKQDFSSFLTLINGDLSTGDSSIKVTVTYRNAYNGPLLSTNFALTGATWRELADRLMEEIISIITSGLIYFELHQLIFGNEIGTYASVNSVQVYDAKRLKITVSGKSVMKLQNITVSNSGDLVANEQADDIANNPIRGKRYFGYGQNHSFKYNNDYVTSTNIFNYAPDKGHFSYQYEDSSLTGDMQKVLSQPPPYKAFSCCTGNGYVKLMPGEIKKSVVTKSYTKNLNQWILFLINAFRSSTSLSALSSGGICNLGSNSFYGFEHVLDVGSEPDVTVAGQVDLTCTTNATYRKAGYCNPLVDETIPIFA